MTAQYIRAANNHLLSSVSLSQPLCSEDFDPDHLQLNEQLISEAEGRGSAWFIKLGRDQAVLRHYYRGGLAARVTRDRFIWSGHERSRAFAEYRLLEWMLQQGLPVPEPLGARVQRDGAFYTCDLITRAIPETVTLADYLSRDAAAESVWCELGAVVQTMHHLGVWHADLNAKNILLDTAGAVSLIDFDRCRRRKGHSWKADNLARLRRSLDKLVGLGHIKHFKAADWQLLLSAYQGQ